jgi:hypothetical protein
MAVLQKAGIYRFCYVCDKKKAHCYRHKDREMENDELCTVVSYGEVRSQRDSLRQKLDPSEQNVESQDTECWVRSQSETEDFTPNNTPTSSLTPCSEVPFHKPIFDQMLGHFLLL